MPLNIDWQQILLHFLNFTILAGGLYFLLYKPVKEFMAKREAYYADRQREADGARAEADALKAHYEKKISAADEEIRDRRAAAEDELAQEAQQRLDEAQQEAKAILQRAQKAAEAKSRQAVAESNEQIRGLALAAVEKLAFSSDTEALDAFLNEAEGGRKNE